MRMENPNVPSTSMTLPGPVRVLRVLMYVSGAMGVVAGIGLMVTLSSISELSEGDLDAAMRETVGMTYETWLAVSQFGLFELLVTTTLTLVLAAKIRDGGRGVMYGIVALMGYGLVSRVVMFLVFPEATSTFQIAVGFVVGVVMLALALNPTSREHFERNSTTS